MWSTMGQAAKQAPQAVHSAASRGPASARKASVVSARWVCSLVMGAPWDASRALVNPGGDAGGGPVAAGGGSAYALAATI